MAGAKRTPFFIACKFCGIRVRTKPSAGTRFCSRRCTDEFQRRMAVPPEIRFWERVQKTDGCWLWTAWKKPEGYGKIWINGRGPVFAHRYSWELAHGQQLDRSVFLCHRCDNPQCVRPDHLFPGDAKANALDASLKGRTAGQRMTHCRRGHEFTPENTRLRNNWRVCRACHRDKERERYREGFKG